MPNPFKSFVSSLPAQHISQTVRDKLSRSVMGALEHIPLRLSLSLSSKALPIFIFHAVDDERKSYIRHLYDYHSAAAFERVLDELLANFRPLEDLSPESIAGAGADRFVITFDDGLRSAYEVAAPILERKGIPAIFFLISDFISDEADGRHVEDRFQASLIIDRLPGYGGETHRSIAGLLAEAGYPGHDIPAALQSIRRDDIGIYTAIARLMGIDLEAFFAEERPYMSRSDMADLVRRGFHLGAHSRNHSRYWEIPLDEQVAQTVESMRTVAQTFGLSYRYFAFPYKNKGITPAFYERTRSEVDLYFTTSGWGTHMNAQGVYHRLGADGTSSALKSLRRAWRPFPLDRMQ